ncbi:glycosyltransferase [Janibacter sp. CX7]|uniref:glycosyltransferase n=1 Tax=Janibacter sp. CX7 TaxID=2963431 RepID=UPI0020CBB9D8|nr:glycosyltransferase [Janibacter sp. CX7]UTT65289.1 glycosyltransferase [Janibacter sp. CX7]
MTQPSPTSTPATPSRRTTAPPATVTAVVVARTREATGQVLSALLAQDRLPDRLLLVDGAIDGLGDTSDLLAPVDEAGIDVLTTTLGPRRGLRRILPAMIDRLPKADVGRDLVWILTSRARPHPEALRRLVAATGRGVGMTAPKLVDERDPSRIVRMGLQVTRAGRIVPHPVAGTTDQGQHDADIDAIAAPLDGLLLDRETYERLDGHDPALGDLGGDLDLGWRSQRAGRRVVIVPEAKVAVRPTAAERRPTTEHRRQARRAALTRAHVATAPFLALWIALSSLVVGLGLVVLKRPGMGADELASLPAALDLRTLRSRLRGRAPREVSRSDLDALFVTPADARRRIVDDARSGVGRDPVVDARSLEVERKGGWLTHPLPWLVLLAGGLSMWSARHITGELRHRTDFGLVGGELLGGRATAGQLWDSWWMAWHGQGWGSGTEQSPALVVLSLLSRLVSWIPGLGASHSPAGVVLALLVVTALPLAAATAWTAGRTWSTHRWVRAAAALAWVTTAPAALAVGEGRIGALLALVLLPRIAAGLVRAGRRTTTYSDTVRTALWGALLATVVPVVGVVLVAVGLVLLVGGDSRRRARGITLAVVPLALAGPWLLALQEQPRRLLTGWGMTDVQLSTSATDLALGQLPGGAPTTWWTAAVLAIGLLALLVPGRRAGSWLAGLVGLLGLAWALGAPHLVLGHRPAGAPDPSAALTAWAGLGQIVLVGAALVAVLIASDTLPDRLRGSGARAWLALPALALLVAAVGSGVVVGQHSYGDDLTTWREPRPLVAVAAAEGSLGSRALVVEPTDEGVVYRLVGDEPGALVRDLPVVGEPVPGEEEVAAAVAQLLGAGEGTRAASDVLAEHAVSHLVVVDPTQAQRRLVDASPGLSRLGSSAGTTTWAVRSEVTHESVPSRVRVTTARTSDAVAVEGPHGDTGGDVAIAKADILTVAESLDWSDRVQVRADGRLLRAQTHSAVPTYELPEGTDEVSVAVGAGHPWWKAAQGLALLLALYLALPTERRPDPEEEDER